MAARVRVAVDANEQQREAAGGATLHLLHRLRQMQAPHISVIPHTWQAWNKERTKIAHNQVVAQYTYKKLPAEEIKVGKKRLQLVLAAHAVASCLGWPPCLQPPCDAHHVMGAPQDDAVHRRMLWRWRLPRTPLQRTRVHTDLGQRPQGAQQLRQQVTAA